MNEYILSLVESDLKQMITEIESEKLCLLMIVLNKSAQDKILSTFSGEAQRLLFNDIAVIKDKLK